MGAARRVGCEFAGGADGCVRGRGSHVHHSGRPCALLENVSAKGGRIEDKVTGIEACDDRVVVGEWMLCVV